MRTRLRYQLAFVLAAIGGGLLIYGVIQWRALPGYSESDIAKSVEVNLVLDRARTPAEAAPSPDEIERQKLAIRGDVEAAIQQERDAVQTWIVAGTVLIALGLAQILLQRWLVRVVPVRPSKDASL